MGDFLKFKEAIKRHFDEMQRDADTIFEVNLDKDELWETYLNSFPAGTNEIYRERREHDCSCCRHFIKNIGILAMRSLSKIISFIRSGK